MTNTPCCQVSFLISFSLSFLCHDRWKGALIIPGGWEINDCLWSRPGPWTTLEAKHVICDCWSKTLTLQQRKSGKWEGWILGKRKWYLCLLPFVYRGILSRFSLFFIFTNSFQWLSNWKMEMLLLPSISEAASWQQSNFLSSGINGIEQYILIKKEPMIAGLPVCHLPTKSSPSRTTTVLSDLIMSRIKSREGKKRGPMHVPTLNSLICHQHKIQINVLDTAPLLLTRNTGSQS